MDVATVEQTRRVIEAAAEMGAKLQDGMRERAAPRAYGLLSLRCGRRHARGLSHPTPLRCPLLRKREKGS